MARAAFIAVLSLVVGPGSQGGYITQQQVEVHVERGSTKVALRPPPAPPSTSRHLLGPAGTGRRLDLAGQAGECESGQVWLRSGADLHNVTAAMTALSAAGSVASIPAAACSLFQVGFVNCSKAPPYSPSGGGYHPDILLEIPAGGIALVPAGLAQPIFLTVCISRATLPGNYTGALALGSSSSGFGASVSVSV